MKPTVIPGSIRADGSKRKDVKVRPGFKPLEERPKYILPPKRPPNEGRVMYITRPYYGKYPSQMTNEELDRWLKEKSWLKPYH